MLSIITNLESSNSIADRILSLSTVDNILHFESGFTLSNLFLTCANVSYV